MQASLFPRRGTQGTARLHWVVGATLFCLTIAVFARVLGHQFLAWDDDLNVTNNPSIQGLDAHRLWWMLTNTEQMRYKPLTCLSYAVVYALGGLNPWAFHVPGLLFHALSAVLLYSILRRLAGRSQRAETQQRDVTIAAALAALLWAVHPLRVEPVAWMSDLSYCQSFFFVLVSVRLYLLAVDGAGMRWYLASVAAFALAVLTHPVSVSCAVVFVVLDLWPARRFPTGPGWWWGAPGRRLWLEKMPYFLLASLFLVTIHARLNPTGIWAPDIKGRTFAPTALVMQAFHVWAHYLWRPWLPFGLAPVYTSLFGFDPLAWPFLVSAAVVIGVTALLLWKRRVFPSALALWACHLLLLIPALGLLEITHYESDRFAYVPGVLWSVALIGLLARLTNPRARRLACAAVAVLVVMAAGASFRQTRVWRDSETLFKYTIESLGPHPYRSDLYWRLGMVYAAEHRGQDAIEQYRKSLAISPGPSARYLLAHALEAQGDLDAALAEYGELLRTHPQAEIFLRVARIRLVQGKTDEAIASFREILRIKPDSLEALDRLAWILSTSDDSAVRNGAEAVRLAGRACDRTGHSTPALLATLAAAQAEAGHLVQAGETARRVLALAQAAGDKRAFELGRVLLARFQSGQPYRDPRR